MDTLQELLARTQIHELADRYAIAVDGRDLDTLAGLFVEDVNNGRYGPGREGVRTAYDNRIRFFYASMHLVGNHVIDFDDDDNATGVVYCQARHHVKPPEQDEPEHWFDMALAYFDTYERLGDGWCFRRRRVRSWYRQEVGHPEHGAARVVATPMEAGPQRGAVMPHAFPTFDEFWARPPLKPRTA
jgi:SnoaL-like domain